ncbi:hypothetical protein N9L68_04450 [bacterium]|nr:hypothetical protein [bacterium]
MIARSSSPRWPGMTGVGARSCGSEKGRALPCSGQSRATAESSSPRRPGMAWRCSAPLKSWCSDRKIVLFAVGLKMSVGARRCGVEKRLRHRPRRGEPGWLGVTVQRAGCRATASSSSLR